METKELVIQIPDGMCIDKEKSTFEKIVFKKKDTKPRSWEEYYKQYENIPCYVLGYDFSKGYWHRPGIFGNGYCTVPSKELAEAFLAMMQLMSLRQTWIGDWKPDWDNCVSDNWKIVYNYSEFMVCNHTTLSGPLSFPTCEMAEEFLDCFRDLIEIAKPLL